MRKIYSLFLLMLLATVGYVASAATAKVFVDDRTQMVLYINGDNWDNVTGQLKDGKYVDITFTEGLTWNLDSTHNNTYHSLVINGKVIATNISPVFDIGYDFVVNDGDVVEIYMNDPAAETKGVASVYVDDRTQMILYINGDNWDNVTGQLVNGQYVDIEFTQGLTWNLDSTHNNTYYQLIINGEVINENFSPVFDEGYDFAVSNGDVVQILMNDPNQVNMGVASVFVDDRTQMILYINGDNWDNVTGKLQNGQYVDIEFIQGLTWNLDSTHNNTYYQLIINGEVINSNFSPVFDEGYDFVVNNGDVVEILMNDPNQVNMGVASVFVDDRTQMILYINGDNWDNVTGKLQNGQYVDIEFIQGLTWNLDSTHNNTYYQLIINGEVINSNFSPVFDEGYDFVVNNGDVVEILMNDPAIETKGVASVFVDDRDQMILYINGDNWDNVTGLLKSGEYVDIEFTQGLTWNLDSTHNNTYYQLVINGEVINQNFSPVFDEGYDFVVNNGDIVQIFMYAPSGVENVTTDAQKERIFNLQGIEVKGEKLPAGIYIVGGKKTLVK